MSGGYLVEPQAAVPCPTRPAQNAAPELYHAVRADSEGLPVRPTPKSPASRAAGRHQRPSVAGRLSRAGFRTVQSRRSRAPRKNLLVHGHQG